jgi:hypothetical protein
MAMEFESEDDEIIDLSTPKPPSSSGLPNLQKKDKSEARKEADALINGLDPVKVARQFRVNNASLRCVHIQRSTLTLGAYVHDWTLPVERTSIKSCSFP